MLLTVFIDDVHRLLVPRIVLGGKRLRRAATRNKKLENVKKSYAENIRF